MFAAIFLLLYANIIWGNAYLPQSNALTIEPPELVQHFRL
jgi:hypothetical protein